MIDTIVKYLLKPTDRLWAWRLAGTLEHHTANGHVACVIWEGGGPTPFCNCLAQIEITAIQLLLFFITKLF